MSTFDRFEVRNNRAFPDWTLGKGLLVAEIYINDRALIEIVREIEVRLIRSRMT